MLIKIRIMKFMQYLKCAVEPPINTRWVKNLVPTISVYLI